LFSALQRCDNNREMVSRVGVHFALEQCHDLLDNDVAGIHFYTLNRSDATRTIFDSLGIPANGLVKPLSCCRLIVASGNALAEGSYDGGERSCGEGDAVSQGC
jgi:hypothetical protein